MLETIITLLIYLCVLALVVYLIIWVLGEIGLALPPQVIKILWVIVALVAILFIVQALMPGGKFRIGAQSPFQERTTALAMDRSTTVNL
jgi:bacteriorhodopsin